MKCVSRFLAMVMSLVLCFSLLPVSAVFAEEAKAELNWSVDGGELWISGQGAILADGEEMPWKDYQSEVTALRIDEGISEIPECAFANFPVLKSVTLPSSLRAIHKDAFRGCGRLFWITLPEKLEVIGDGAFADCGSMNSVFIPNLVGSIGAEAFESKVTINGMTGSASEVYAAQNKNAFASLGLHRPFAGEGSWNGIDWTLNSGVLTLSGSGNVTPETGSRYPWESGRADITTLAIKEGITGVAAGAFRNCCNLKSVSLPESLTSVGEEAFAQCGALKLITLTEGLKEIGTNAFDAGLTMTAPAGSPAESYARDNDLTLVILEEEAVEAQTEEAAVQTETEEAAEALASAEEAEMPVSPETTQETVEAAEENVMAATEATVPEEAEAEETEPEVFPENVEIDTETLFNLSFNQVYAKPGDSVELILCVQNNPGICALDFLLEYDHDILTLESFTPVDSEADWTVGIDGGDRVLLIAPEGNIGNGEQLILTFAVTDEEKTGRIPVQAVDITVLGENEELLPGWVSDPGWVVITASSAGDVNDDGEINGADSLLLKAWLVGLTSEINNVAADINGDGEVNLVDALHLDRYLLGLKDTIN